MEKAVREMTFEEQYEILKNDAEKLYANEAEGYEPPFANCVVRRAMRCIKKLLCETESLRDRQAPKKPNLWGDGSDSEGNIIYDIWDCPSCGYSYEVDCDRYDYCPECGQAIDWSDQQEV